MTNFILLEDLPAIQRGRDTIILFVELPFGERGGRAFLSAPMLPIYTSTQNK